MAANILINHQSINEYNCKMILPHILRTIVLLEQYRISANVYIWIQKQSMAYFTTMHTHFCSHDQYLQNSSQMFHALNPLKFIDPPP